MGFSKDAYWYRVWNNIKDKSQSKYLFKALEEWEWTEGYIDNDEATEICEHTELRYQYEIQNVITEYTLWIGSVCILGFKDLDIGDQTIIKIFDEHGNLLNREQADKNMKERVRKHKKKYCVEVLKGLVGNKDNYFPWLIDEYERKSRLHVWHAQVVFRGIFESPEHMNYFKIGFGKEDKYLLLTIPDERIRTLSVEQRLWIRERRGKEPLTKKDANVIVDG